MKTLISFFITIYLLASLSLFATDYTMITDLGSSARSIALGNVYGYADSAEAVFANPASFTAVNKYTVSVFSTKLMNEVQYFNGAISVPTRFGTLAAGIYEQSVSNITSTTRSSYKAVQSGSYDYKNSVFKLAYQENISANLSVGITFSHYNMTVEQYSAAGSNLDAGLLASFERFKLSIYAQNILLNQSVVFSNDTSERLPFTLSTTAIIPVHSFTLLPQLKLARGQALLSSGLSFRPGFLPLLTVNAGYNEKLDYIAQKHKSATLGASLQLLTLDLHVAYERSEHIEMDHNMYASFSYRL
ncbi:hypothetical protein OAJ27_01010 [bacterium]|nr:hypothetical protein [bacterium]